MKFKIKLSPLRTTLFYFNSRGVNHGPGFANCGWKANHYWRRERL